MEYLQLKSDGRYGVQWKGDNLDEMDEFIRTQGRYGIKWSPIDIENIEGGNNKFTVIVNQFTVTVHGKKHTLNVGDWIMAPLVAGGNMEIFNDEYVKIHYVRKRGIKK